MVKNGTEDGVLVEANEGALRIVIDRPERKGSLDTAAVGRLVETLEGAATDDSLRVILLTSAGSVLFAWALPEGDTKATHAVAKAH